MVLTSKQIDALKLDQLRAEIAGLLIPDSKIEMHEVIVGEKLRRDVCWFRAGHGWNPAPDYPGDIAAAWTLIDRSSLLFDFDFRQTVRDGKTVYQFGTTTWIDDGDGGFVVYAEGGNANGGNLPGLSQGELRSVVVSEGRLTQ